MHMQAAVLGVALVAVGAFMALVALMPRWLRQALMSSGMKAQARMRSTGERNPYIGPETDLQKFLAQLRIMAMAGTVVVFGLAVVVEGPQA